VSDKGKVEWGWIPWGGGSAHGPFDSREAALADAYEYCDPGKEITVNVVRYPNFCKCLENAIDFIINVDEYASEDYGLAEPLFDFAGKSDDCDVASAELQTALKAWADKWVDCNYRWLITKGERIVIEKDLVLSEDTESCSDDCIPRKDVWVGMDNSGYVEHVCVQTIPPNEVQKIGMGWRRVPIHDTHQCDHLDTKKTLARITNLEHQLKNLLHVATARKDAKKAVECRLKNAEYKLDKLDHERKNLLAAVADGVRIAGEQKEEIDRLKQDLAEATRVK
jgi:hypothetical protein